MAQRGCEACPDVDATARHMVATANGGTAYYHLHCRPETANDTSGLHPRAAQYVHAREQATGSDQDGYSLGSTGEVRAQGVLVPLEDMTWNGRLVTEVSDELTAADA